MTHDRTYLRMMHDCELTRYAQDNVRTELEFVMLERLKHLIGVEDQLEDAKKLIDELSHRCDIWQAEAMENLTRPSLSIKEGAQAFVDWQASLPPEAK
jgi:hypothetical protein